MKSKKVSISFIILLISALISGNLCYSQGKVINQSSVLEIFNEIYILDDFGCNIAVSTGHDGVLIIDSGSESSATGLDSLISVLSNSSVRYILNTHFHFDHVGGNKILADNGTIIIAQANTRNRMMTKWDVPVMLGIEYPTIPPYNERPPSQIFIMSNKLFGGYSIKWNILEPIIAVIKIIKNIFSRCFLGSFEVLISRMYAAKKARAASAPHV